MNIVLLLHYSQELIYINLAVASPPLQAARGGCGGGRLAIVGIPKAGFHRQALAQDFAFRSKC